MHAFEWPLVGLCMFVSLIPCLKSGPGGRTAGPAAFEDTRTIERLQVIANAIDTVALRDATRVFEKIPNTYLRLGD